MTIGSDGEEMRLNARKTGWRFAMAVAVCAALVALSFIAFSFTAPSHALATPVANVALQRLIPNERIERPVHLAALPGTGDLVVVEQAGVIKRFTPGQPKAAGMFLDIHARVSRDGNEEGLLSVAFHPRFAENHALFVYYSVEGGPRRTRLARFTYDPARQAADPASERVLLEVSQPFSNHKGGQLAFGLDGFLYVGLGDGGSGGDPYGNGQNRDVLLAKILRLDVDSTSAGRAYGIPADNPFAGGGGRPEVFAYGVRNPWRFGFDRETGKLWLADVGQDRVEEVDVVTRGGNYGWNAMEGAECFRPARDCSRDGKIPPVAQYFHDEGISITGGFVYRGAAIPSLRGQYVFGDFGAGTVWTISAAAVDTLRAGALLPKTVLLQSRLGLSSFGEDAQGELYLLDLYRGGVYRLVPAS
jgi:glucose/arabinose dehydrogenase